MQIKASNEENCYILGRIEQFQARQKNQFM